MGPAAHDVSGFDAWRNASRPWLEAGREAAHLIWDEAPIRVSASAALEAGVVTRRPVQEGIRFPRSLMGLLEHLAYFRHASRWEFMYRLAWRVLYENSKLLTDAADPDVAHAHAMDKAVRRDLHKMHAFVRFREIDQDASRPDALLAAVSAGAADGGGVDAAQPHYFAWFEPQHEILRPGARFFVERFPNMQWTIATPDGAAVWNQEYLQFVTTEAVAAERPQHDSHEELWRTYYRSICNIARLNRSAMQREMPQHYWKNLPEAAEIGGLMRKGSSQIAAGAAEKDQEKFSASKSVQRSLGRVRAEEEGIQGCRACDLWKNATQAVEGEGPKTARLMLVGEQPGDEEDLQGRPFVGPAGRLLNELLTASGLTRQEIYITNAVKHFKWEPRGRRRLHKKPNGGEIRACNGWLRDEIEIVRPLVIVALGASALNALLGVSQSIEAARMAQLTYASGARLIATYHPSALLRADADRSAVLRAALLQDLKTGAALLPADGERTDG